MRHALTLAALLIVTTSSAIAADQPDKFKWTSEKFALVASGNAKTGEEIAAQNRCKKCHNEDGVSDDAEIPTIAGQRATYLYKQLTDFHIGRREEEDMTKAAKKLDEQDMIHLAAFYQQQERPQMVGGDAPLVVKVCDSCHNEEIVEEDNNIEVAPILKGQNRQYLENTMQAFKQRERANDLFVRMQSVTHKLTDQEIKQLARYYGTTDPE
ncbi:MAG: c-type cytochrome [Gammaproteobacteria bacterium]|nr:c-type cytochrome [Gammaproteobacteria bacterium]MCB1923918.1 c-type cytochrome [Gammaproteobacteria bacterium]